MNRELISVIDELGRSKGIEKSRVIGAIEAALLMAAKKRLGQTENIQVEINAKTVVVEGVKRAVAELESGVDELLRGAHAAGVLLAAARRQVVH